jgi:hypothetical protein
MTMKMSSSSDAAFFTACKDAGLSVGVESGRMTLAFRAVFEAGVRHGVLRHMSAMWMVAEESSEEAVNARAAGFDLSAVAMENDVQTIRRYISMMNEDI